MSLFHCAICLPDLVERVYIGDGNLQVAVGDELCQFCEHLSIGGVSAASLVIDIVIYAAIMYYLWQPSIQRAFGRNV